MIETASSDFMPVWLQVSFSILLFAVVIWWMWRLPQRDGPWLDWAPMLALAGAWLGLAAALVSALLWFVPFPDYWVWGSLWLLDPAAMTAAIGVFWIYRHHAEPNRTIAMQRTQASVGMTLGGVAIILGYLFVMLATPRP